MIAVQGWGGGRETIYVVKLCIEHQFGRVWDNVRGYPLPRWGLFWKFGYYKPGFLMRYKFLINIKSDLEMYI